MGGLLYAAAVRQQKDVVALLISGVEGKADNSCVLGIPSDNINNKTRLEDVADGKSSGSTAWADFAVLPIAGMPKIS